MYMKDTLDAPAKKGFLVKSDASKGGGGGGKEDGEGKLREGT